MQKFKLTLMALVLALGLPALAETKVVAGNKHQATYTLASGDSLQVMGNHNLLVADGRGDEATVNVMGNHNEIKLIANGGTGDVTGNDNLIIVDGNWATVNVVGNNNTVRIVKRKGQSPPAVNRIGNNTRVETVEP